MQSRFQIAIVPQRRQMIPCAFCFINLSDRRNAPTYCKFKTSNIVYPLHP